MCFIYLFVTFYINKSKNERTIFFINTKIHVTKITRYQKDVNCYLVLGIIYYYVQISIIDTTLLL